MCLAAELVFDQRKMSAQPIIIFRSVRIPPTVALQYLQRNHYDRVLLAQVAAGDTSRICEPVTLKTDAGQYGLLLAIPWQKRTLVSHPWQLF